MNNYVYITAGLPDLTPDWRQGNRTIEEYLEEVRELCSKKDNETLDFIDRGFNAETLDAEFYKEALKHKSRFIREFFLFDLCVRNAKVRYLNDKLGRDSEKDVVSLYEPSENDIEEPEEPDFPEAERLQEIFAGEDILRRERMTDDLYWDKIDEITLYNYMDFDAILGIVVKMHIINRWLKLDENTGREMFRKLVDEVRGTFKGVDYKSDNK